MDNQNQEKKNFSFVQTRINLLQELKKSATNKNMCILTIGIENYKKLRENVDKYQATIFLEDALILIDKILFNKSFFAQYESHLYVAIFKDIPFKEVQKIAYDFQLKIVDFISQQKFNPFIELFTFDLNKLDFKDTLTILDKISSNTLAKEDIDNQEIKYIQNKYIVHNDDDEIIYFLLKSIFIKEAELKLVNFYKGLKVSTKAKILKLDNDFIKVKFEYLQGIVMTEVDTTILKSSSFTKDIEADIKYVSLDKKIVILENFNFIDGDIDQREYHRVTPATKTPIRIYQKLLGSISGEIIELSVDAISIKTTYTKILSKMNNEDMQLSFILPYDDNLEGFVKVQIRATIFVMVYNYKTEKNCKIVCKITPDTIIQPILMEYIHKRQKEIIWELQNMAKKSKYKISS